MINAITLKKFKGQRKGWQMEERPHYKDLLTNLKEAHFDGDVQWYIYLSVIPPKVGSFFYL